MASRCKFLWLLLICTILVLCAAFPAAGATLRIMPLGDSITNGDYDGLPSHAGYRLDLWTRLSLTQGSSFVMVGSLQSGPSSIDRHEEGHPGYWIANPQDPSISISTYVNSWVTNNPSDVVLLMAGTNDIWGGSQTAASDLSSVIDVIVSRLPSATVLVGSIPPSTQFNVTSFNSAIPTVVNSKVSQGKNVRFVDTASVLNLATDMNADGVHPNLLGYNKLAYKWYNAIMSPTVGLTLYRISDTLGSANTSNPGNARTSFGRGETVRVTLAVANTGGGSVPFKGTLTILPNGSNTAAYDSNASGQNNSAASPLNQGETKYLSFDWTIPSNATLGAYDLAGALRDSLLFDSFVYDTTEGGTNNTSYSANVGSAARLTSQITVTQTVATAKVDFNGDGKTDIVWRNLAAGQTIVWLMNGNQYGSFQFVSPAETDTAWDVIGQGDFNSDGKTDLLWANSQTGELRVWFMNGMTFVSSQAISLPPTSMWPLAWKVAAVADFNSDGKADLLWRNSTTGENTVWVMNGLNTSSIVSLAISIPDTSWKIVGAGDFNGDGKPDILWRNSISGQNIIWIMNGTSYVSFQFVDPTIADTNWQVAGVGDFSGDSGSDILWRNSLTGQNIIWTMNGTTFSSFTFVYPSIPGADWRMVGPR
jgi:hypothetical protein